MEGKGLIYGSLPDLKVQIETLNAQAAATTSMVLVREGERALRHGILRLQKESPPQYFDVIQSGSVTTDRMKLFSGVYWYVLLKI